MDSNNYLHFHISNQVVVLRFWGLSIGSALYKLAVKELFCHNALAVFEAGNNSGYQG